MKGYLRNAEFAKRGGRTSRRSSRPAPQSGVTARELPPVTADGLQNRAAAFVEPIDDGRSHGTWLVSNALASPQSFVHDGRTYVLSMRPRREYLPYALTLKDFRHDVYPGTDIPKNFSSVVHLSNPATGEERDVLISMNQPLRYGGKTFYQASFGEGDTLSVLQVVENPGWLLPYISAALVTLGLLVHFAISLRRGAAPPPRATQHAPPADARMRIRVLAPWIAGAVAVGAALAGALPSSRSRDFDVEAFGRLPVLDGGSAKPIDSVARNALLMIRGQQSFRHDGRRIGADEWLLDVMFRAAVADAQPVFRVRRSRGARARRAEAGSGALLLRQGARAVREGDRGAGGVRPAGRRPPANALPGCGPEPVRTAVPVSPAPAHGTARGHAARERDRRARRSDCAEAPRGAPRARALPTTPAGGVGGRRVALDRRRARRRRDGPRARGLGEAVDGVGGAGRGRVRPRGARPARRRGDRRGPRRSRTRGTSRCSTRRSPSTPEWSSTSPRCSCSSPPGFSGRALLQRVAFGLLAAGAIVHTAGLVARIVLQGRPPVTNLYSSAVFVGWGAVVLGDRPRAGLPPRHRHGRRRRRRVRLADHRPPPRRRAATRWR